MIGGLGHLRKRQSIWLKQHWKQANKDGDSKLVFDEVSRLCRQLNINMSRQSLKAKFGVSNTCTYIYIFRVHLFIIFIKFVMILI